MSYGQTLNSTLPVIDEAGPGYATKINNFLEELQDIVEAKVTPSGITVNSDLSFSSGGANYLATELKATSFADQASPLSGGSYPSALYFADGELYCNDGSGNQIQLTESGLLNAGAVGGITGGNYGTDGKVVNWVDASNLYEFKDGSGTDDYADIIASGVRLADGSSNYVALAASTGMSGNYTLTFPTAAPGSTQIAQVAASGAVSYSNTVANKVTFSTEFARPSRVVMIPAEPPSTSTHAGYYSALANPDEYEIPLPFELGWTITKIGFVVYHDTSTSVRTYELGYVNSTTAVLTYPGGDWDTTDSTASTGVTEIELNFADFVAQDVSVAGTKTGFLMARATLRLSDRLYGVKIYQTRA